ncbi:MAG: alpha-galactosidase, partial [Muribaculaceae bacterium]|nr:alpha-galactosidase [Muribaculaceae bacterium]
MNRYLTGCVAAVALVAMVATPAFAEIVEVSTPTSSLILDAKKGKKLRHVYYGAKISDKDTYDQLKSGVGAALDAYPAYGMTTTSETAVAVTHADGNMTLDLVVDGVSKTRRDGAELTTVKLRDTYYPFYVDVNYRTYDGEDVIETWTEISHGEKGEVTLTQFASGYLPVRYGDVWLSHLYGTNHNEGHLETEPLTHGMKVIKNKDGVRNSHTAHSEVMIS